MIWTDLFTNRLRQDTAQALTALAVALLLGFAVGLLAGCATTPTGPSYPMTIYVCSLDEVTAGTCPVDLDGADCDWYTDPAGVQVLACQGLCTLRARAPR